MSLVLRKWAETTTHVLVHVYLNGERLGSLAFQRADWAAMNSRVRTELFIGEAV